MAGYYGYSMSNNAVAAYDDGLKPISKWTKSDFLSFSFSLPEDKRQVIKAARIKELKRLLKYREWHHTSSMYNETDFYGIDEEAIEEMTADELASFLAPTEEKKAAEFKAVCTFLEWSGTRKHPKATEMTEEGIIRGNWFYRKNGSKKSIIANGFKIRERL